MSRISNEEPARKKSSQVTLLRELYEKKTNSESLSIRNEAASVSSISRYRSSESTSIRNRASSASSVSRYGSIPATRESNGSVNGFSPYSLKLIEPKKSSKNENYIDLNKVYNSALDTMKAWFSEKTKNYKEVKIVNLTTSWSDGLALCALLHHFFPKRIDYAELVNKSRRERIKEAYRVLRTFMPDHDIMIEEEDFIKLNKNLENNSTFLFLHYIYKALEKLKE